MCLGLVYAGIKGPPPAGDRGLQGVHAYSEVLVGTESGFQAWTEHLLCAWCHSACWGHRARLARSLLFRGFHSI